MLTGNLLERQAAHFGRRPAGEGLSCQVLSLLKCKTPDLRLDRSDAGDADAQLGHSQAGRCTDCGACERVCPVGIPVRQFTKKLEKDARELFDWEAGLTLDKRPLLDFYKPNDPDEFIK